VISVKLKIEAGSQIVAGSLA